jgi:DNA-binding response OmpR family regulator
MSKILLVGNDLRLLTTRAAVLGKTNASVVCCSAVEAMKVLETETFNLVVLCHSLEEKQAAEIIEMVHGRLPETRILMVVSDVSQEGFYKGGPFDATSSTEPNRLIQRVSELLRELPNSRLGETVQVGTRLPVCD